MLILHQNVYPSVVSEDYAIYCEQNRDVIPAGPEWVFNNCIDRKCPYYAGQLMGDGVECYYEDQGSETPIVITNPFEFCRKRHGTSA